MNSFTSAIVGICITVWLLISSVITGLWIIDGMPPYSKWGAEKAECEVALPRDAECVWTKP